MPVVIRIVRLNSGQPTPFDGKLLAEYDPARQGVDPSGRPMLAHVRVTDDLAEAMQFVDAGAAHATWALDSGHGRPDGRPDRPLTAFTIALEKAP